MAVSATYMAPDTIEPVDFVPPLRGGGGPGMRDAITWLAGRDARVLLVDCFDTLVQRIAEPPSAVRTLACTRHAAAIRSQGGGVVPGTFRAARDRVEAEIRARRTEAGGDDEAGLLEILHATLGELGIEAEAKRLAQREIELEVAHSRARSGASQLLKSARRRGMRVAVLSDMYLPAAGVRKILARHGLIEASDLVLTSGDEGVNKASGRLYSLAMDRLGMSAREAVMIGDDLSRDHASPTRLGIESFRVSGIDEARAARWRESVQLINGDLGSLIDGEGDLDDPVRRLGRDALAPLLLACARSAMLGGAALRGHCVDGARAALVAGGLPPAVVSETAAVSLAPSDPATRLVLEAALGPRPGMHHSCAPLHEGVGRGLEAIRAEHPLATAPVLWNGGWGVLRRVIDAPSRAEARAIGELAPAGGPKLIEGGVGVLDLSDRRRRRAALDREAWPTGALATSVPFAGTLQSAIGGARR